MQIPAKINLGLNVIRRRTDGYHDLETVFLPIPLYDYLRLEVQTEDYPFGCQLTVTGDTIECDEQTNLVVKAYNMLAEDYPQLTRVHAYLDKHIPSQAGMGGGSADAAYMLKMLNKEFALGLEEAELERYASKLGADCAVFVKSQPAYAEGIGEKLYPMPGISNQLKGKKLAIVKPDIHISTREAYSNIHPKTPQFNCLETVMMPVEAWKGRLFNDFETVVFPKYPELQEIKESLLHMEALYASMSGSGSAIYGIFEEGAITRLQLKKYFPGVFTAVVSL